MPHTGLCHCWGGRVLPLLLAYICYLLLGATVFQILEKQAEAQSRDQFQFEKLRFLENYTCLDQQALEQFVQVKGGWCCCGMVGRMGVRVAGPEPQPRTSALFGSRGCGNRTRGDLGPGLKLECGDIAPKFPHGEGGENNHICATDIPQQTKSTF